MYRLDRTGKSLSFYGEALPFLSLGYLIHKYEDYLIQFRYWWLLGLIALVTGVVEWYLLRPWGSASPINPFFGSLALAPCLLLWALRHKSFGSNHWGETIGRDYSSDIYYFHIAVSTLCWKVFSLVGLRSLIDSDLEVVIVFIASLILAWGIQQIRGFIKQVKSD